MLRLRKDKRGNLLDWFYIIPVIFTVAVATIISFMVIVNAEDSGLFTGDAEDVIDNSKNAILNFDNMIFFCLVGLSLFTLVSAAVVFNHPAFFFISLILLAVAIVVAAMFSNAYETLTGTSYIEDMISGHFSKTNFIMSNFPVYLAFMGILTMIVMGISYSRQTQ